MKKIFSLILAAMMLMSLAACGSKTGDDSGSASGSVSEPEVYTNTPVDISGQQDEFTKVIVPLNYGPSDEVADSLYYTSITKDDGVYYMVQPESEDEPMYIPVSDAVIYLVSTDEECKVTKTSFDYTPEGGETTHITQYRIFSTVNSSSITVAGDGNGSAAQAPDSTDAAEVLPENGGPETVDVLPEDGGDVSMSADSSQENG